MKRAQVLIALAAFCGCSGSGGGGNSGTMGVAANGGTVGSTGGVSTLGGASSFGSAGSPGISGAGVGGGSAGVSASGGASTGGSSEAGASAARSGAAGSGGTPLGATFYIGADITDQETQSVIARANLLALMKAHGFNYVRLRTFVAPTAADGYDQTNGFDDLTHTIAFGKQVKDAGMGLLVDFHYSDNWADPGKQCVPVAWQSLTTIAELSTAVHDYTKDAIAKLIAGGARPDMVQIGNESTPGILIHRCNAGGMPLAGSAGYNAINGAIYLYSITDRGAPPSGSVTAGGWTNLGMLLNAGAQGVKEVDTGIKIALHLDRGNDIESSRLFIQNAMARSVPFDVFAESCYLVTQGQPANWQMTFSMLAALYPTLNFMIAEYSGAERAANDVMFNLAGQRGVGTFNWQPATLWTRAGTTYTAGADLSIYDQIKIDYAGRL